MTKIENSLEKRCSIISEQLVKVLLVAILVKFQLTLLRDLNPTRQIKAEIMARYICTSKLASKIRRSMVILCLSAWVLMIARVLVIVERESLEPLWGEERPEGVIVPDMLEQRFYTGKSKDGEMRYSTDKQ